RELALGSGGRGKASALRSCRAPWRPAAGRDRQRHSRRDRSGSEQRSRRPRYCYGFAGPASSDDAAGWRGLVSARRCDNRRSLNLDRSLSYGRWISKVIVSEFFLSSKYSLKYLMSLGTGDTPGKVQTNTLDDPETGPFDYEGGGGMGRSCSASERL